MTTTVENMTVTDARLAAAVKAVGAAIPRRSNKPVLLNAKLTATADGFHVYATDLETQLSVTVGDADGTPTGETLLPAGIVAAIGKAVKAAPAITLAGDTVSALGMTVPVEDVMEYPIGETPIDDGFAAMIPFNFVRLVDDHISCATDDESSRYALGGVLLERIGADETLRGVGTDGRRLHLLAGPSGGSAEYPREQRPETSAIVFPHAIRQFRKAVETMAAALCGKAGKAARLYTDGGLVGVKVVNGGSGTVGYGKERITVPITTKIELSWAVGAVTVRMTTRCVDGRFPRWRDVFRDTSCDAPCYLPMPATVEQVKAAARAQSESSKGVKLADGRITAQSAENGTYDAAFVGDAPIGTVTKLDPRFWTDAASAAAAVGDGGAVKMYVIDPASAVIFEAENAGIAFKAAVMPLAAD